MKLHILQHGTQLYLEYIMVVAVPLPSGVLR